MKMSATFETRLESTGTALRDRPSLVDQVMAEVRQKASQLARPRDDSSRSNS